MKKNVAGQFVGAQLITAADGTPFTGAVTVAVTGDAGTQATGSVGAGACTHEGGGYHTYAPAQAETNYDLIAFTFSGSGAISATLQVYTIPTTGLLAPTTAGRTLTVSAAGDANADLVKIGGVAQSATDLKDFADEGYDPGSHYANANLTFVGGTAAPANGGLLFVTTQQLYDVNNDRLLQITSSNEDAVNLQQINGLTSARAGYLDNINNANLATVPAFPSNFASLGINASGHVSRVVLVDTLTTYTGNTPQTGDTYALANGVNGFVATKADTAAIKTKTDSLTFTVAGFLDSNMLRIGGQTVTAGAGVTFPASVASPTNITAGTITTVTNLTNLPAITTDWVTAAGVSAAAANKIADHTRRRTQANVESSSDGDTLSVGSLYGFIQQAQESLIVSGTLTIYKTDGSTSLGTKTLTTSGNASPITGVS
jgi:hypothetical protein